MSPALETAMIMLLTLAGLTAFIILLAPFVWLLMRAISFISPYIKRWYAYWEPDLPTD